MIGEIRIKNFRSYDDKTVQLSPTINLVVGSNATGKTNLLEAVLLVCAGNSYRANDQDLIKYGRDWSKIEAIANNGPRTVKIMRYGDKTTKEFVIDNKTHKRLSLNHQLPVVLFEPNHLLLVSGSPELRRNYLDSILDLIKPNYKHIRLNYIKVLKQRNALLKQELTNKVDLFPWDVRLSQLGGYIASSRAELIDRINQQISDTYRYLANSDDCLDLSYVASVSLDNYESGLLNKLNQYQNIDIMRGFTTHGPHREDINIMLNHKQSSIVASRGENRTIVVSLKAIEAELIHSVLSKTPIILLDDIFSELDKARSNSLIKLTAQYQSIITSTDIDVINKAHKTLNVIRLPKCY